MKNLTIKKLIKQWLPTIIVLVILAVWTMTWCLVVSHKTKVRVTEELTIQYQQELQDYIAQLNYVPEDEAKNREIEELADYMDELVAGYSMNSNINQEGCYAICWCFIARLMTQGFFGNTPEEILNKEAQWQYYNPSNPVRSQDTMIARIVAEAYVNRHFPDDFTTDLCYAELKGDGTVVLRNELYTNSNTKFWKYKMGS